MSELTKDQLKSELVSHGVELPSSKARKSEYVRMYEKYVAPVARSRGDFSSDDEDLPVNDVRTQASVDRSLVINGVNVSLLDDDELYARLKDLGANVGPIVDSTRSVYQKKLFVLLGGQVEEFPSFNGDVDEEYSDSEGEVVVNSPRETHSRVVNQSSRMTTTTTSPMSSQFTDIRKRVLSPEVIDSDMSSSLVFDPDRHTPSPRRSLRTVSSSTSETVTYRKIFNNGSTTSGRVGVGVVRAGTDVPDTHTATGKSSSLLRLLVKLLFLALIVALALYFYQNTSTESPFKAIEELARQALEAATGEETATSEGEAQPPTPLSQQQEEMVN